MKINWLHHAKDSNFEAALSYLTLACGEKMALMLVNKLKKETVKYFAAKDILRAAVLKALSSNIEHVRKNIEKMKNNDEIGPVMLCRFEDKPLIIADGMHRISASWHLGEDNMVAALYAEDIPTGSLFILFKPMV